MVEAATTPFFKNPLFYAAITLFLVLGMVLLVFLVIIPRRQKAVTETDSATRAEIRNRLQKL